METNLYEKDPFKQLIQVIVISLLAIALSYLVWGCASKPIENTKTKEIVSYTRKDSVKITVINGAINDTLKLNIATVKTVKPECDSVAQLELERTLKLLNSYKSSGENKQGVYYDALKKQLVMWQKLAQTKNENTATSYKYIYIKADKEIKKIPVKYIPWWVKSLAFIGLLTLIYITYRISRIWI